MQNQQGETDTFWWKFCLSGPGLEQEAEILFEYGFQGTQVINPDQVEAYIQLTSSQKILLAANLEKLNIRILASVLVPNKNWTQLCPELWNKVECGAFTVCPLESVHVSHSLRASDIGVIPGAGFGTGHHPSTALALSLLQSQVIKNAAPARILDLGTGSGILAIAAAKLFNAEIVAIDNDPSAIRNAKDNLSLNKITTVELLESDASQLKGAFNLILANMYAELLEILRPRIEQAITADGFCIFAGILEHLSQDLISLYERNGWRVIEKVQSAEWVALLLQRDNG
jgi:ribosomal protein L11 methyltransferase